jgi:hypothetical protein
VRCGRSGADCFAVSVAVAVGFGVTFAKRIADNFSRPVDNSESGPDAKEIPGTESVTFGLALLRANRTARGCCPRASFLGDPPNCLY